MATQRKSTPKKARPTQRKASRKTRHSPALDWKPAFLTNLALTGNATEAAEAADIVPSTAHRARKSDAAFDAAWDEALEEAADRLETEARRRAVTGVDEPVFGSLGGKLGSGEIGTIRKYSDTLLIFLLKGARPSKYRENFNVNHAGRVDSVVSVPQLDAAILKVYGDARES